MKKPTSKQEINSTFLALFIILALIFLGSELFGQSIEAHTPQPYGAPSLVPFQLIFKDKAPVLVFDATDELIEVLNYPDQTPEPSPLPQSKHYQIPLGLFHQVFLRTSRGVTSIMVSSGNRKSVVIVNGRVTEQYKKEKLLPDVYLYNVDYFQDTDWAYTTL